MPTPVPTVFDLHCRDNIVNFDETDVDCGGDDCGPCAVFKECIADSDCQTGLCSDLDRALLPQPTFEPTLPQPTLEPTPPPTGSGCYCAACGTSYDAAYGSGVCGVASGSCSASVGGAGCYSSKPNQGCNCATNTVQ